MAKYYNNKVKSGKVAGSVFSVRFGEVIERGYNPIVRNPNTPSQIESRAKMKLLSQLSAVIGPYVAIPRQGAISARNRFVSENYGIVTYNNNQADITLTQTQITKSAVALPDVAGTRSGSYELTTRLITGDADIDRVVYVAMIKTGGELRVLGSQVSTERGSGNDNFVATFNNVPNNEVVVLAYGVRDNTEEARVHFGNLQAVSAETIAKLIVSRVLTETDVTLTATKGVSVPVSA